MIKLSDYIFKFVSAMKVKHVFLLSGGGAMHLVDSLGRSNDLKYICCLHEQAASIAAAAYSQYTNNIGVALVTTGPGGTNAVTGIAAAWLDSIPVLYISGQVKRADMAGTKGVRMLGFQEIDIVTLVKSITKYAVTVMEPSMIRHHLEKAVHIAKTGRPGPVLIDIPLDVQATMIDEETLQPFTRTDSVLQNEKTSSSSLQEKVEKLIELLNLSDRPVILAGCGIILSNAQKGFLDLIEKMRVPVLTTWKTCDLMSETHDLYCGRPGAVGQRGANFIQQNSDLIITIGARLDFGQIGYSYDNFARAAKKVIVDIDSAEINKLKFDIEIPICTPADSFIKELYRQIEKTKLKYHNDWLLKCKKWQEKYPVILPSHWAQRDYVSTYALTDLLSDEMNADDILVPGSSGACAEITMQSFRVKEGQRVLNMPGLGAMGFGLPCSIGACLASGGRRTVCINGDGGFQLNIQDLETVSRFNLPIKYFILNNDGYGSIRNTQRNYFNGFYVASGPSSGVTLPDIKKIAVAYRIRTVSIRNNGELREKTRSILSQTGPVICEVIVDPLEPTMPKLTSQVRDDGTIVSKPLEDLWPFLDREEFNSNMIIKSIS